MLDFFRKSLRNKLLFIFITIGFLPFLTLLVYTLFLSESKIVNKIIIAETTAIIEETRYGKYYP